MRVYFAFILLLLFGVSCNPCKNTNCLNGGSCEEGHCVCAVPFAGKNCEINLCDSLVCNNGGYCDNGTCNCDIGYEGVHCDSLITTKFAGSFSCTQNCSGASPDVSIYISGPPSACNIEIYPLGTFDIIALVNGYTITIQSQILNTGQTVSGTGQMSANRQTITITMTVIPSGLTTGTTCTYNLTRQ